MEELNSTLNATESTLESLNRILTAILERLILESKKKQDKSILNRLKTYAEHGGRIYSIPINRKSQELFENSLNTERVLAYKCESVEDPEKYQYLVRDCDVTKMLPYVKESMSLAHGNTNQKNKLSNHKYVADKKLDDVLAKAEVKLSAKEKDRALRKARNNDARNNDKRGRKYER